MTTLNASQKAIKDKVQEISRSAGQKIKAEIDKHIVLWRKKLMSENAYSDQEADQILNAAALEQYTSSMKEFHGRFLEHKQKIFPSTRDRRNRVTGIKKGLTN